MSEFQKSVQENLENTINTHRNSSFWSLTALDKEHKDWIEQYDLELSKHKTAEFEGDDFKNIMSSIRYIAKNAFDGLQRFRMRGLKRSLMCYEEFMIGALNGFKSIQHINVKDEINISRCFASNLHDQVQDIKHALFNSNDTENKYIITNIVPFVGKLEFMEALPQDLEMRCNVRYYYSLQNDNIEDDLIHKYADVEWRSTFEVKLTEEGRFETFKLCDKGFLIHNIEVDYC